MIYDFSLGGDFLFSIQEASPAYLTYRVNIIYDRLRDILSDDQPIKVTSVKINNYYGIYCNGRLLVTLTENDARRYKVPLTDLVFYTSNQLMKLDFHCPVKQ